MESRMSVQWLEEQFPELTLIADPTAPTITELRFLLDAQGDPRRGMVGAPGLEPGTR